MTPADSLIARNCSSGSTVLNRCKWSRQQFPAASSVLVCFCTKEPTSCGSRCFVNCSFAFETDLSTPLDVCPGICSTNSSHKLDTAPKILSWFAEWIARSKTSMIADSAVKCIVLLPPFLLKIPRLSALVPRNMGWPLSSKCLLHLIGFSTFHTIFLHFQDREMTNVLTEIFSPDLSLLWNLMYSAMNFPDMNRIIPSNCSGFIRRTSSFSWIFWRISIVVNPGTYSTQAQLILHRFQTALRTRLIVEILWSDFSIRFRHSLLLSPTWSLDHDTE